MALNCYRCNPPKEPCVLVIDRISTAPLCEKCGVQQVDIVERLPFPVEEYDKARNGETVEELSQADAGEETGPDPMNPYSDKPPTFEEVDLMDNKEVLVLADALQVPWEEGDLIDDIRTKIKSKLAVDQVEAMER